MNKPWAVDPYTAHTPRLYVRPARSARLGFVYAGQARSAHGHEWRYTRQAAGQRLPARAAPAPLLTLQEDRQMLIHRHIRNFKGWRDTGPMPLAPLTIIFGDGSAGKGSLEHLPLPFYCQPQSTVWLDQSDIFLHPRAQASWADALVTAPYTREQRRPRETQIIVESHSESFLRRLQRRVAEGTLAAEQVAIYCCEKTADGGQLTPVHLNQFGALENCPDNMFSDPLTDISARAVAVMTRIKRSVEVQ